MQPYVSPIMLTGGRDSRLDDPLSPTAEHWNSTQNQCLKGRTILSTRQILSFGFQRCAVKTSTAGLAAVRCGTDDFKHLAD